MIEIFLIFAVLLAVIVLFYRQAIEQYNILQIEGSQLEELPKLVNERSPVVIRGIGDPKLFTPATLKQNQRLLQYPIGHGLTLGQYLDKPILSVNLPEKASTLLAKESGLAVWVQHTWYAKFFSYSFLEHIHMVQTDALLGEQGLQKATAILTVLYPTAGPLEVTLLTEQQQTFLPNAWRGQFPEAITIQDTPLAGSIKYITVKVRPGTLLCIPTHWFYSIRAGNKESPCLWSKITIENPISWVATRMERSM